MTEARRSIQFRYKQGLRSHDVIIALLPFHHSRYKKLSRNHESDNKDYKVIARSNQGSLWTISKYSSISSLLTNLCLHWQIIWTSHGSINFCEMLLIKLLRWTRALEEKFPQTLTYPKAAVALLNPSTAVVVTGWLFSPMKFLITDPQPELSSLPSQGVEAATWGKSQGLLPSPLLSCLKWSLHQASRSPCVHAPTPCQLLGGSPCSLPA